MINTAEARELAKGNPKSFLHVSRPEIDLPEGIDEHDDAVYAQGTKNLTALVAEGALLQDPEPHLYLYAQRMGEHRQIGVVGCASVAEYEAPVEKATDAAIEAGFVLGEDRAELLDMAQPDRLGS